MASQRRVGLDLMEAAESLDTLFPRCSPKQVAICCKCIDSC